MKRFHSARDLIKNRKNKPQTGKLLANHILDKALFPEYTKSSIN